MIYSAEKLINQDLKDKIKQEQSEKVSNSIKEQEMHFLRIILTA